MTRVLVAAEARVREEIARNVDRMVDVRRQLHANPELSFEELATTELVRDELVSNGATLRPCPTPTGVVGMVEGGRPGGTVLVRADIDALPVEEATGLSFSSHEPGRMHACGHDAHTAILLEVAAALGAAAEDLPGRYLLVFQPAEERVSGARAMVDGGLLDDVDPVAAIGLHVVSSTPTGSVLTRPGVSMAGSQGLRISITSGGGHGALQPRQGNVVLAASTIATRLHTVVEGLRCDGTDAVCSPGLIAAGTAFNVLPTRAELGATLRWFDKSGLDSSMQRLAALVHEVKEDFGVSASVSVEFGTVPVRNDPGVTATVLAATQRSLPDVDARDMGAPVPASDDMSVFLDAVPGCYLLVGAAIDDGTARLHHTPTFAIDEHALVIGATALATSAVALAAGPASGVRRLTPRIRRSARGPAQG